MSGCLPFVIMSGSPAMADGQGKEARGRRLAPQYTGKDRAGFLDHGTGDI